MCDECAAEVYGCGKAGWFVVLLSMLTAWVPSGHWFWCHAARPGCLADEGGLSAWHV